MKDKSAPFSVPPFRPNANKCKRLNSVRLIDELKVDPSLGKTTFNHHLILSSVRFTVHTHANPPIFREIHAFNDFNTIFAISSFKKLGLSLS